MYIQGSTALLSLVAVAQGLSIGNRDLEPNRVVGRQDASATCLKANAVQTGSEDDGQQPPVAGQVASATDKANFINFCSGQVVTNGLQTLGGSCNGIVMGKIPSNQNMISAIIVDPKPGENKAANQDFTISVQVQGLTAGKFTNAQKTYYAAPQDLDGSGKIIGHTHVTVQDMGNSLTPTQPLDPKTFVFFKGINDAGNGQGLLSATITGGLPAGNYRVCSMTSASNHQPVLMPVAQRGAQDDCQKFTVGGNGGGNGGNAAGGKAAGGNAANAAGGKAAGGKAAGGKAAGGKAAGGKAAGGNQANTAVAAPKPAETGAAAPPAANKAAVAGIAAPAVTDSGNKDRPFSVNGNTFVNKSAAVQRACDIQNNGCSDAVNGGKGNGATIAQCQAQQSACLSAGGA